MTDKEIDENLYSRQLYVLGHDAMKKMGQANVLISGMSGLGIEIAKNTMLSGVKAVTIQDTAQVQYSDLSSGYYFSEEKIGQNSAKACVDQLQELTTFQEGYFWEK